jgi:cold shock protein
MATGTVRFFNQSKGFGLITPDIGGPALFAQASDIRGGKKLKALQHVEFDVVEAPEGIRATNIRMT